MSAALAPEEFELVIPEKKTTFPQVITDLNDMEFLQSVHQAHLWGSFGIFRRHA